MGCCSADSQRGGGEGLLDLSVVAPAHNEEDNIAGLVEETDRALSATSLRWELLIVDDGSTDRTRAVVQSLMPGRPWLRCIAMQQTPPGRGNGQSAAFHAGIRAARGSFIATIDADLQNDPADLPLMMDLLRREGADFVQGDRSRNRKDSWFKRFSSVIGRTFRRMLLGDRVRDTGCSLRVMRREIALAVPLQFKGMHRFVPVTARQMGYKLVEMDVRHRARTAGKTKYGFGVGRAFPGLMDCFAVRWMNKRRRPVASAEVASEAAKPAVESPRRAGQASEVHA